MKHLIILDFVKGSVDIIKISDKTAAKNDKNDSLILTYSKFVDKF